MSERLGATLKYLVRGVQTNRDAQHALQQELRDALPSAQTVTVLPVVEGFSLELDIDDIAPFSRTSFEPYVAEHVVRDAVNLRCDTDQLEVQLLKSNFRVQTPQR